MTAPAVLPLLLGGLPLLTLACVWIVIRMVDPKAEALRGLLRAFLAVGIWLVLTTEGLSLGGLVNQTALVVVWGLPAAGFVAWIAFHRTDFPRVRFDRTEFAATRGEWAFIAAIGAIFALTAIVAWLAPPQTWDSLNYHMARVAHWAQMESVRPYATGIEVQNSRSPLAEFAVLHTYVLAQSDRWANFVQWMAMVGSVLGVGAIARQLGLRRPAALLAMAFAATIPMGIIQASSTMTDYVGALWVVVTASEVLGLGADRSLAAPLVFSGAAAGLVFLTKPTAVPYLLPLGVLAAWLIWRRRPVRVPWTALAAGGLAFLALNAGHSVRSTILYGDPISGGDQLTISAHANDLTDPRALASNIVRNVGLHLGTPSPHVNKALTLAAFAFHRWLGIDPNDPRTTAVGVFEIDEPTTNEIKSGNPIHLLVGAVAGVHVVRRRRTFGADMVAFLAACLGGFLLFSWLFKWQVFGSRLHLPFFVLLSPVVGGVAASALSRRGALLTGWALVLSAVPWLVGIASRPLFPLPGEGSGRNLLTATREQMLFATGEYLLRPYTEIAAEIGAGGCEKVGISLSGHGAEYPIWSLLGAPRPSLRIEWLVTGTPSAKYRPEGFMPCAVVCEGCEAEAEFAGLPLAYDAYGFRLYLRSEVGK